MKNETFQIKRQCDNCGKNYTGFFPAKYKLNLQAVFMTIDEKLRKKVRLTQKEYLIALCNDCMADAMMEDLENQATKWGEQREPQGS